MKRSQGLKQKDSSSQGVRTYSSTLPVSSNVNVGIKEGDKNGRGVASSSVDHSALNVYAKDTKKMSKQHYRGNQLSRDANGMSEQKSHGKQLSKASPVCQGQRSASSINCFKQHPTNASNNIQNRNSCQHVNRSASIDMKSGAHNQWNSRRNINRRRDFFKQCYDLRKWQENTSAAFSSFSSAVKNYLTNVDAKVAKEPLCLDHHKLKLSSLSQKVQIELLILEIVLKSGMHLIVALSQFFQVKLESSEPYTKDEIYRIERCISRAANMHRYLLEGTSYSKHDYTDPHFVVTMKGVTKFRSDGGWIPYCLDNFRFSKSRPNSAISLHKKELSKVSHDVRVKLSGSDLYTSVTHEVDFFLDNCLNPGYFEDNFDSVINNFTPMCDRFIRKGKKFFFYNGLERNLINGTITGEPYDDFETFPYFSVEDWKKYLVNGSVTKKVIRRDLVSLKSQLEEWKRVEETSNLAPSVTSSKSSLNRNSVSDTGKISLPNHKDEKTSSSTNLNQKSESNTSNPTPEDEKDYSDYLKSVVDNKIVGARTLMPTLIQNKIFFFSSFNAFLNTEEQISGKYDLWMGIIHLKRNDEKAFIVLPTPKSLLDPKKPLEIWIYGPQQSPEDDEFLRKVLPAEIPSRSRLNVVWVRCELSSQAIFNFTTNSIV